MGFRSQITLHNVSYAYPLPNGKRQVALRDISLEIAAGEYVAIVGANGSGKSTLARLLNALLLPDTGQVTINGLDTRQRPRHREIRRTVGMVFQRPDDQLVATVVEEDVAFGPENLGLPPDVIRARVQAALERVGMWQERHRPPHLLSAGQQQRIALAGVLAMRPQCIVFDEATAMLDPAGRRDVRALMQQLHAKGLTIVTITHFMEEAAEAERVIVLADGQVALDAPPAEVFADGETLHALGLELPPAAALARHLHQQIPALPSALLQIAALVTALDALPHRRGTPPALAPSPPRPPAAPLIDVANLGHVYLRGTPLARRALEKVSLAVAPGEIHGLLGATGSGKSTLLQHLNGLLPPQEGRVCIAGFDLTAPEVDVRAVRRLAGLAFQRPEVQIFEQYVGDEIAYGPRLLGLEGEALRERVRWAMELLGLDFAGYKDRLTFAISGGERRKVALASILALRPRILLLDEPTAGLDPVARRALLSRLRALLTGELTLALSSHRMEDLAEMTERLTVLDGGAVALKGSVNAVFAQAPRLRALGLDLPVVTAVADALRERGWPLPPGLIAVDKLAEHLRGSLR